MKDEEKDEYQGYDKWLDEQEEVDDMHDEYSFDEMVALEEVHKESKPDDDYFECPCPFCRGEE